MIVAPNQTKRHEKIVEKSLSERYNDAFEERELNINKIPKFLSPFQTEDLQITYGAEQEINIERPIEPPSPNTSLNNAAKYVLHLKSKGFNATSDQNIKPDDVYERIVNPMRRKRNEQAMRQKPEVTKSNKSTNLEDYQRFWHSLDSVTRIVKEIRALPVDDCTVKLKMEEVFHDSVTSIVRIMKHDGLLDGPKSRQKLNSSMLHFITEIRKSRKSIIETLFKDNEIDWNKLTENQKKEFSRYKPAPVISKNPYEKEIITAEDKQKNEDIDAKILQQISDNVQMLPSMYRFQARPGYERQLREHFDKETPKLLNQISRSLNSCLGMRPRPATVIPKINSKNPIREHRPRVLMSQLAQRAPKPSFIEPKPSGDLKTEDNVYNMYWEFSDPLASTRDGDFRCPQKTFDELTDNIDINLNSLEDTEFEIPQALMDIKDPPNYYERKTFMIDSEDSVPVSQKISRLRSLKSMKSISLDEEEDGKADEEEDNEHILKKPTTEEKIKNVLVGSQTCGYGKSPDDDMKYLMGQTFELAHDTTGEALYKRLEEIWSQLGFTVMQKLDMAIKYTQNSDENSRLGDSMSFWEGALVTVERYQKSYRELKDYMQLEIDKLDETNTNFTRLVSDVRAAEELLISLSQQMKQTYGDDLIISRRKVNDLIADRRNKIARIIFSKNNNEL